MHKVIYRTIRESKDVPFYPRSKEVQDLIMEKKRLGHLLLEYSEFDQDLLIHKYVAIWKDKSFMVEFNQTEVMTQFSKMKQEYDLGKNHQNNIINEDINE